MPIDRDFVETMYKAFNARDLETALSLLHPEVDWPNGMEGGRVRGHSGVRDYWTRQWGMIDPRVEPLSISTQDDGRTAVEVHAVVRDLDGNVLVDHKVVHVYSVEHGLVTHMEIQEEKPPGSDA